MRPATLMKTCVERRDATLTEVRRRRVRTAGRDAQEALHVVAGDGLSEDDPVGCDVELADFRVVGACA